MWYFQTGRIIINRADISSFGHNNDDHGLSGGVEAPVGHDFLRLDRGW